MDAPLADNRTVNRHAPTPQIVYREVLRPVSAGRQILKLLFLSALVTAGGYAFYRYEKWRSAEVRLVQEVRRLEEQKKHLQEFVARLTSERRVADIIVTDQTPKGNSVESTTLLFVEYARDGSRLLPRFFTVKGHIAHVDALVIKFDHGFIENNDPLRGHSIVLFHRIFGEYQTPSEGHLIDEPGQAPDIYRGPANQAAAARAFEAELWRDFWKLADDPSFREKKGVRVAQGESPWTPFHPDRVYTLTLEAAGGLNIVSRPMDGLFREFRDALKRKAAQTK
jgi:hypothetical protein